MRIWELVEQDELTELFKGNSALPYEVVMATPERYVAKFNVEDNPYEVTFSEFSDKSRSHTEWDFAFYIARSSTDQVHDNSGTGNEFRVYSTVLVIAKEFIGRMNPGVIWFEGHGQRGAVYAKMLKRLASELTKLGCVSGPDEYDPDNTEFYIKRKDIVRKGT